MYNVHIFMYKHSDDQYRINIFAFQKIKLTFIKMTQIIVLIVMATAMRSNVY